MTPEQIQVQRDMDRFMMEIEIFANSPDVVKMRRAEERVRLKQERLRLKEEILRLKEGK